MVGAIIGAMVGKSGLPPRWTSEIGTRNKIDFDTPAHNLYELFVKDYADTYAQAQRRQAELSALMSVKS
jgi:hypothetical protein